MLSEGVNVHHCDCNYSAVPNTTLCISQIKASEANNELKHEKSSETHLPLSDSRGSNKQFALDCFLSHLKGCRSALPASTRDASLKIYTGSKTDAVIQPQEHSRATCASSIRDNMLLSEIAAIWVWESKD